MKIKLACLGLGALLAATGAAQAGDFSYGAGLRDRVDVPAPIPVPAPVPVPEGFTYYLRADLSYDVSSSKPSYSDSRLYGTGPDPFTATAPFAFTGQSADLDHVLSYGVGFGAYFTPHIRGDLTLEFHGKQNADVSGAYSYLGTTAGVLNGNTVNGTVTDNFRINSTIGLANLYFDLLPRGTFSPYVGAGVGFVYNQIDRHYLNVETEVDGGGVPTATAPQTLTGASKDTHVGLAAALTAGATIALDQKWVIDVSYRALFLDGGSVPTSISTLPATSSRATLDDHWDHQVRVGLRFNIW